MPAATYLDEILAAHRTAAAADRRDIEALLARAAACGPPRPFGGALTATAGLAVIAEIKRRSPSRRRSRPGPRPGRRGPGLRGRRGRLPVGADRRRVLRGVAGRPGRRRGPPAGCRCCARTSPSPAADVCDARLMGADAVLLIVAALTDAELGRSPGAGPGAGARRPGRGARRGRGGAGPRRRGRAGGGEPARPHHLRGRPRAGRARWRRRIPAEVVAVAESGIRDADDAGRLADAGYQAVLVGESLVRAPRPASRRPGPGGPPGRARGAGARRLERDGGDDGCSSRSAGSPPRPTPCWPWRWAPTPSGSSSPPRPARSRPRPAATSSSGCPPRCSRWGCSATRRRPGWWRSSTASAWRGPAPRRRDGRGQPRGWPAGGPHHQGLPGRATATIGRIDDYGADYLLVDGRVPGLGGGVRLAAGRGGGRPGPAHRVGRPPAGNVADAIAHLHPFGVDVSHRGRVRAGAQGSGKLRAFVASGAGRRR